MSDVYQTDPDRILLDCAIGGVQAWRAPEGDTAIALSFYAGFKHAGETQSYTSACHNLTIADARSIAAVLIKAADHAESLIPKAETPLHPICGHGLPL